jgi:glycosyltransferase involved in cell wall biosynthesis
MKILQVITLSELGGAQSVVLNLANQICKDNDIIVAAGGNGALWQMLDKRVTQVKIDSLHHSISFWNDIKTLLALRKIYNKYRPDIIHLHSSKVGILGRLVFPKNKIIYTVHGFDSIRVAYRQFLPLELLFKRRAKAIIAVSDYDRFNLKKEGIYKNVHTVYNGIPKCSISHKISWPFRNTRKTILTIARVSPQKRFDLFVEVAKLLPSYNFVWIGNKEIMYGLPNNVYCLGEIPNAGAYCSISDLCMLPSNYEGLPIFIIEAMSFGKPIVASDVGGMPEIVINDWNGYTVENDPEKFAECISKILNDEAIQIRFSENSLKMFEERLTVQKMSNQYLDLYNLTK